MVLMNIMTHEMSGAIVSEYTNMLTARQLIECIANDYVELSHEKILLQRNDYIRWCREWLETYPEELDE
jgi:hypothetical protein